MTSVYLSVNDQNKIARCKLVCKKAMCTTKQDMSMGNVMLKLWALVHAVIHAAPSSKQAWNIMTKHFISTLWSDKKVRQTVYKSQVRHCLQS